MLNGSIFCPCWLKLSSSIDSPSLAGSPLVPLSPIVPCFFTGLFNICLIGYLRAERDRFLRGAHLRIARFCKGTEAWMDGRAGGGGEVGWGLEQVGLLCIESGWSGALCVKYLPGLIRCFVFCHADNIVGPLSVHRLRVCHYFCVCLLLRCCCVSRATSVMLRSRLCFFFFWWGGKSLNELAYRVAPVFGVRRRLVSGRGPSHHGTLTLPHFPALGGGGCVTVTVTVTTTMTVT